MTPMTREIAYNEGYRFTRRSDALDLTIERVHYTSGDIRKQWSEATILLNGVSTTIRAQRTVDALETVGKAVRLVGDLTNNLNIMTLSEDVLALGFNNYKRFADLDASTAD
jgi:hypothetical protein